MTNRLTSNGNVYWAFTDIFKEGGPPELPFPGGFGLINLQGIRKPDYFSYKFLAQLGPTDITTNALRTPGPNLTTPSRSSTCMKATERA